MFHIQICYEYFMIVNPWANFWNKRENEMTKGRKLGKPSNKNFQMPFIIISLAYNLQLLENLKTLINFTAEQEASKDKTENNCLRNRWHTCPELHKAMDGVTYIADHTKKEEESTRVSCHLQYCC